MSIDTDNRPPHSEEAEGPQTIGEHTEEAQFIDEVGREIREIDNEFKHSVGRNRLSGGLRRLLFSRDTLKELVFFVAAAGLVEISVITGKELTQEAEGEIDTTARTEMWSQKSPSGAATPIPPEEGYFNEVTRDRFWIHLDRVRLPLYAEARSDSPVVGEIEGPEDYPAIQLLENRQFEIKGWCYIIIPRFGANPGYAQCADGESLSGHEKGVLFTNSQGGPYRDSYR